MRFLGLCISISLAFGSLERATASEDRSSQTYVPDLAKEAATEGNRAFATRDYKTARSAYQKVLELSPNNLLALINLGMVEFADGKPEEAEKVLRQALSLQLDNSAAWLTLGTLYLEQGRLDAAHAALAQAVLNDPRNPRSRNYLGVILGRKGWIDAATDELRKAVEIEPAYSDAHYNLSYFYLERQPPLVELARRHYHRSLELGAPRDRELEGKLKPSAQD